MSIQEPEKQDPTVVVTDQWAIREILSNAIAANKTTFGIPEGRREEVIEHLRAEKDVPKAGTFIAASAVLTQDRDESGGLSHGDGVRVVGVFRNMEGKEFLAAVNLTQQDLGLTETELRTLWARRDSGELTEEGYDGAIQAHPGQLLSDRMFAMFPFEDDPLEVDGVEVSGTNLVVNGHTLDMSGMNMAFDPDHFSVSPEDAALLAKGISPLEITSDLAPQLHAVVFGFGNNVFNKIDVFDGLEGADRERVEAAIGEKLDTIKAALENQNYDEALRLERETLFNAFAQRYDEFRAVIEQHLGGNEFGYIDHRVTIEGEVEQAPDVYDPKEPDEQPLRQPMAPGLGM
ncbi:MAG: hypothetical protein GC137_08665 [Alphaproteobacteria bacterium]|nr:hypothetical protein [Alphaproteobacteria bacterium]